MARFLSCVACLAAMCAAESALAQSSRRERQDPELIVESGGRLAYCDQMLFTPDGKWVLTTGDDKVVRLWACTDGKLDPASMRVLRWNIWREKRGAIYALAVSPDPEARYVMIGGTGEATTTVAVLDRFSGEIVHWMVPMVDAATDEVLPPGTPLEKKKLRNLFDVLSVTFAPSGKQVAFGTADGSVFVWDFKTLRLVGRHEMNPVGSGAPPLKDANRVWMVRFLAEDRLLSVAESSEVVQWDLTAHPARRVSQWLIGSGSTVRLATLSPDNRWLAVGLRKPTVALRSVDGTVRKDLTFEPGQFPRSLAFDTKSARLAVGVGMVPIASRFFMETDDHVQLYDVGGEFQEQGTQKHTGRAESVAFHPDGKLLAVAGGNDHEVSLYEIAKNAAPVSVMRGAGNCLWDVAISEDGGVLGFKDQRNAASLEPNNRAQGPWRTFNLGFRKWNTAKDFKPVERLDTVDGWTIRPDDKDKYAWWAVRGGKRYELDGYDGSRDGVPRCYTFIEADADNPARLVVGHYWGLSVYELGPDGPKRVRLCVGHQGEVTAVGLSANRSWLVSSSNDQTISAWSLSNKWPSQRILGAAFEERGERLRVTAVDAGSPAWEAGLVEGDDVVFFAFDGKPVAGAAAWHKILLNPKPGKEHYFSVLRAGKRVDMLTTARQRPLWRFFPTRENEWVLWMWRNSFYDTSTKGDSYIGWHVNSPERGETPKFYRAEQFHKIYNKKTVIDKLLLTRDVLTALKVFGDKNALPVRFDASEPPGVKIDVAKVEDGWEATLTATPHGENPDHMPREGELWVNDFRLKPWANVSNWEKVGRAYVQKVPVPADVVRAGENILTFQTSNRLGGRAEASATINDPRRPPAKPRALGLVVGINNYRSSKPPRGERNLGDLVSAVSDARSMKAAWELQPGFSSAKLVMLTDEEADRTRIEKAFDDLASTAKPDDLCVIFLAGHGMFREEDTKDAKRSLFIFCCPRFEGENPETTGLTSEVLHEKLAAIKCRKLVLLDACHSGEAATNPVRVLTPTGQGPVILAACDRNQHSYENPKFGHGLFTFAVLEALGENFAKADADGNKKLDTRELYTYALGRLPQMLGEIKQDERLQVPIMFAPQEKPFVVTARE